MAGAGDVNGDGYADVIVGADYYDAGRPNEGAAFVFLGSASGIANGQPGDGRGRSSSRTRRTRELGSERGRGRRRERRRLRRRDRGRPCYDAGQTDEGAAFVFLGSAAGIASGNPGDGAPRSSSRTRRSAYLGYERGRGRGRERRRLRAT